jgi:Arm DNA-binding domain
MDMALSDTTVRQARAKGKYYTLNDLDGLSLFVRAKGSKHWYFRFSWDGKQQRISVGRYPEVVEVNLETNPANDLDIVAIPQAPVTHNPFLRMNELPTLLCNL